MRSKSIDHKKLIKMLKDDGWFFVYQKGSHRMYQHPTKIGKITVPCHGVSKNIEIRVMKQAGIGRYKNRPQSGQNRLDTPKN